MKTWPGNKSILRLASSIASPRAYVTYEEDLKFLVSVSWTQNSWSCFLDVNRTRKGGNNIDR